ncbi:MAG: hypothetical protein AB7G11_17540, partial [Phycisphaerales bacterium]
AHATATPFRSTLSRRPNDNGGGRLPPLSRLGRPHAGIAPRSMRLHQSAATKESAVRETGV